ncbi:MAG TPA: flagellar hook-length control protein FliK [Solirubrobacteraceae bacterium]|nr:flagellar hook-length control protein FliK [Solirubrobacteraceae bacterium]
MRTISTAPATAPPTVAPESGSPPTQGAGAPGDFAAALNIIATARTAVAEGHTEADKPAADDQSTAGDRERDPQSTLDPATLLPALAEPAVPAASGQGDKPADQADGTAPDQVDAAASAVPMASVLALTTAALAAPVAVTTPALLATERASAPLATPIGSARPASAFTAVPSPVGTPSAVPASAPALADQTPVTTPAGAPAAASAPAPAPVTTTAATPGPAPVAVASTQPAVAPVAPVPAAATPAPASDDQPAVATAAVAQPAPMDPASLAPPVAPQTAAAAQAAPSLPVRPDHIRAMLRILEHRGQVQAQLTLHPAELGGVEVRLRQTAHGLMATVTADRADAAHVLQQAGADLRRALEAQGVQIAGLDIGLAGENQDAANARANERRAESGLGGSRRESATPDNDLPPIDPDHRTTNASTIALGALVDVLV